MYQYYVLYMAWWWLNEPKHVAEFLNVNIVYKHVVFIDWLNYCIEVSTDSSYTKEVMSTASVKLYRMEQLLMEWWTERNMEWLGNAY